MKRTTKSSETPLPKKGRKLMHQTGFLAAIAEHGNIGKASATVGIERSTHLKWQDDPEYVAAFDKAMDDATDKLVLEARRRAEEGVEEPVFYKGEIVGYIRRYSDALLMFTIKARRPEYRDRGETYSFELGALSDAQLERIARGESPLAVVAGNPRTG